MPTVAVDDLDRLRNFFETVAQMHEKHLLGDSSNSRQALVRFGLRHVF